MATRLDKPGTKLHVLLLEDNLDDAELIEYLLEKSGLNPRIQRVDTKDGFLAHLTSDFDVILSDHSLPQFNAFEALDLLKQHELDIPFVIVSGTIREEAAVEAVKQGADDYLLKDRPARLGVAIRQALARRQLRREREQREQALEEANARFRTLEENVPGMIYQFVLRPDGSMGFPYVSPGIKRLWNIDPDVLTNNPNVIDDLIHPDDLDDFYASVAESARTLEPWHWEGRFILQDEVRWFEAASQPQRQPDGSVLWNGLLMDITEQKRAEEAEVQFRDLVEQSLAGIYIITRGYHFAYVNPTLADIFGYTREEIVTSLTVADLVHEDDVDLVEENIQKRLDGDLEHLRYSFRGRRKDGRVIHVEVHGKRSVHEGQPAVLGTLVDITDRKRYEAGLIEAKERAEELNQLKNAFLVNMSHEIRTPLTAILGFSEILVHDVPEETREVVDLIHRSGQRLLDTLTSVLDLAKLESGAAELTPEPFDLAEEIRNVIKYHWGQARERGLSMTFDAPDDAVPVTLDPNVFHHILRNLLSNAIKFTEEGSITVTLEAKGPHVVIHVRDTGIGISPDFHSQVFDAFKQESTGLDRDYEGGGLGLTTTKRLTELMSGTIEVESRKGEGSVFTVQFPRRVSPVPPRTNRSQQISSQDLNNLPTASTLSTVLLVEDNPETQKLVQHQLGGAYELDVASSGEDALAMAESNQYDAVLLDINLGLGLGGEDVLHELRKRPSYRETPIITVTAHALPQDRERFLKNGFDGYLSKPFTKQQLTEVLEMASHLPPASSPPGQNVEALSLDELLELCLKQGLIDRYEKTPEKITVAREIAYYKLTYAQAKKVLRALLRNA